MYNKPINIICIPIFKSNTWPTAAIIKGNIAPPTIPVKRIPENIEWFLGIEFSPKDIITDHTPEIEKPKSLNDRTEISESPWIAKRTRKDEEIAYKFNNFFSSTIFTKKRLTTVPIVKLPQKEEITSTPTTSGSKEWYWYKNSEDQLFIPCSTPT